MDKRKAAFIMAAVGAVITGAVAPLASVAECYIYKFTTQPVTVQSNPTIVRRFVDRVQPTVTYETPVQMQRTISQPVMLDNSCPSACPPAPMINQTLSAPVMVEKSCVAPVVVEKQIPAPVCIDRCPSNPTLFDRSVVSPVLINGSNRLLNRNLSAPVMINGSNRLLDSNLALPGLINGSPRFINRSWQGAVTVGGPRGEMLNQLRTLGLPIVMDTNDLHDWDTVKIKRKRIGGVRQLVLEVKD